MSLPFFLFKFLITASELYKLSFNSNTECLCSKHLADSTSSSPPHLKLLSTLNNIPHLNNTHIDLQLLYLHKLIFFSTHDFYTNSEIHSSVADKSFSVFHCSIRSLAANCYQLHVMLEELK